MKKFILILLFILPSVSYAEYTGNDFLRDASYTLIVADWMQTLQIADDPINHSEGNINWIIGKHPSRTNVNTYFISKLIINYLMNKTKYADCWNAYIIIDTGTAVYNNYYEFGLKLKF